MAGLPPPPINDKPGSFTWLEWYRQLRNYVSTSGSVPWYIINFSGSNLTDIALRDHANLQNLQGGSAGQHYHLTQQQAQNVANLAKPTVEYIDFDSTATNPAWKEGRVFYDKTEKCLSYYNEDSDVTVNIGQENLVRVYNNTGSVINNGSVVYINGASFGIPNVALARADILATSDFVLGVATDNIQAGSFGYITTQGTVHDVNTFLYNTGDVLYLSDTTAGAFTNVAPLQPSYNVRVGTVVKKGATDGDVFVHVDKQPWFPSVELLDTRASVTLPTTPTLLKIPTTQYNDGFVYNSTTGELTFTTSGSYAFSLLLNAQASASNKTIYFYAEIDTGSGFQIRRYSARSATLVNNAVNQLLLSSANYFAKGTKIRFYLWSDTATVNLITADVPGTTAGTVTIPAARLLFAG